jgi:PAS domain S-box-containing protein
MKLVCILQGQMILLRRSSHFQAPSPGEALPGSFVAAGQSLAVRRQLARVIALAGLVFAVFGLALKQPGFDLGTLGISAGVLLLLLAAFRRLPKIETVNALFKFRGAGPQRVDAGLEDIKDAHWALADNAARYRELLDAQRELIVQRTTDGRIVFANRAFCEAFGVQCDAILGTKFEPLVVREDVAEDSSSPGRRVVQLLQTGSARRWISWDVRKMESGAGAVEIQSVGRDVSLERAIEAELREARDMAEAGNRAKSRFLAAMSHEIRTPMTGILGMISLLRDTPLDADQRTSTRIVEDSARALLVLIDDILDFSKVEAGKLELTHRVFSLKACIAQAMQLLAPGAAAKQLSFTSTVTSDVPEWVRGDEVRVRQIVLNLVSNAVKFTDKGGVAVCVSMADSSPVADGTCKIAVKVIDTGIGVPAEFAPRLFGEFEQCDNATTSQVTGAGLGLAISKRLAQAMGGDIVADTNPGEGTSFTAILCFDVAENPGVQSPADRSAATVRLPALRASEAVYTSERVNRVAEGFNVLIAEDNPINALLARKIVTRAGGTATIVEDGRLAIAAVWDTLQHRKAAFDLILMDVLMPGIDGLAAAKSIKDLFRDRRHPGLVCPPIIALTAHAFAEDRERCYAAGLDDYLAKPFEADQLQDVLLRWAPPRIETAPPAA